MTNYFENFSLRSIILAAVLFFSFLIFLFTMLYLGFNVREQTKEDSKMIVDRYTKSYALEINGLCNEAVSITRTLVDAIKVNKDLNVDEINPQAKELITKTLLNNPDFISVWFDWEIVVLDPTYSKQNGRISNMVFRPTGEIIFERELRDTTDMDISSAYYDIKNSGKEIMGEPYFDEGTEGLKGMLLVSPTVPIMQNGTFQGMVGVDLNMKHIQEIVKSIKPFEKSEAYLLSPQNVIVGHSDETFHFKNFFDNAERKNAFAEALKTINQNKENSFIYYNTKGEETYVSLVPINIGRDNEIWTLGTETPIKSVLQKSNKVFYRTITIGFFGILILCVILYFILKAVTTKLYQAIDYSHTIAKGDLSNQIEITGKNEIAKLGDSLNQMANNLKNVVSNISGSSNSINQVSNEIAQYSSELLQGSSSQAVSIEEVLASIEEMTSNILNNSDNAKQTEVIAEKALAAVKSGSQSAKLTADAIYKIVEKISLIQEISKQTNILAINAAIEAARAGEHGRGFAVVANEVKILADHAREAAEQINQLSADSVSISFRSEQELSSLVPEIEKTAQLVREIVNANVEESQGATQVQNVIQQLNTIAQENSHVSEELNIKAQNLTSEANRLKDIIKIFKI